MITNLTPAARKARTTLWTSRLAFGLGVVVSMSANVLASPHTPVGIAVALWVPTAFLITMALLENIPVKGRVGQVRFAGVLSLALIAGWTSYWHLVEVALMGGADTLTAHLLPLTVDVMMALASPGMKRKATPATRRRPAAKKTNVTPITKGRKVTA